MDIVDGIDQGENVGRVHVSILIHVAALMTTGDQTDWCSSSPLQEVAPTGATVSTGALAV